MCNNNKNVTKMGLIMKGFTEVCFAMTKWHHVNKGHDYKVIINSLVFVSNYFSLSSLVLP
jgi:hypothetical protein